MDLLNVFFFKQKTAYEMLRSLVGSEMCIRDRIRISGGVFLFLFGMTANIHCDYILRNLRKPGETGYKIPQGE